MVKNPPASAGDSRDSDSIPGSGRSPGGGSGSPLQCSCPGNPVDTGAWWAVVPNKELNMTECAHSTSCLVLLRLPCMFWGHLLASIYYDLLRSPCQGLTHLYLQHLMHLTLPSLCLRTSTYLNQSPLQNTSAQIEHTYLSQIRGTQSEFVFSLLPAILLSLRPPLLVYQL